MKRMLKPTEESTTGGPVQGQVPHVRVRCKEEFSADELALLQAKLEGVDACRGDQIGEQTTSTSVCDEGQKCRARVTSDPRYRATRSGWDASESHV